MWSMLSLQPKDKLTDHMERTAGLAGNNYKYFCKANPRQLTFSNASRRRLSRHTQRQFDQLRSVPHDVACKLSRRMAIMAKRGKARSMLDPADHTERRSAAGLRLVFPCTTTFSCAATMPVIEATSEHCQILSRTVVIAADHSTHSRFTSNIPPVHFLRNPCHCSQLH